MNHVPVSHVAFNTVNKIMTKYEPKHKGAWMTQNYFHHTEHALNHILAFDKSLLAGVELTETEIEDVESCLVRCAFILANIARGMPTGASPSLTEAEALDR